MRRFHRHTAHLIGPAPSQFRPHLPLGWRRRSAMGSASEEWSSEKKSTKSNRASSGVKWSIEYIVPPVWYLLGESWGLSLGASRTLPRPHG
jgi:hypothetical protein